MSVVFYMWNVTVVLGGLFFFSSGFPFASVRGLRKLEALSGGGEGNRRKCFTPLPSLPPLIHFAPSKDSRAYEKESSRKANFSFLSLQVSGEETSRLPTILLCV